MPNTGVSLSSLSQLPERPLPTRKKRAPSTPSKTTGSFSSAVGGIEDDYQRRRTAIHAERKIGKLGHYSPETLKVLKKHGIEKFHGVIIPYLKRSGEITPKDGRFIQTKVERMIRRGELKRTDKNDLGQILKALGTPRMV